MDAYPLLARIAQLLERHGLEAVLIGNAAAALQGAPVTTVDFDFLFRRTPSNVRKLSAIAAELQAVLMKPHYPVSGLLRISRDDDGLQLDFMGEIDGIRSFEGLRKRALEVPLGDARILVAAWLISSRARHATIDACQVSGFVQRTAANPARSGRKQR